MSMPTTTAEALIIRALLGALVAGVVAALARRAGSLSASGQWGAFVIGTIAAMAGWAWAGLLIGYFVVSSALTRLGAARKAARTASVLPDAHARSATQVFANGGVFALLAVLGTVLGRPELHVMAGAALAAAASDTWATEFGTLWGGQPRDLLTFAAVEPGMSGGVTLVGFAGSVLGALAVGAAASRIVGDFPPWIAGTAAFTAYGVAGSLTDSVLGGTLQSKRWCEQCRTWTERRVHTCLYRTQHRRGVRWMTNDTVNLLATAAGALVAGAWLR